METRGKPGRDGVPPPMLCVRVLQEQEQQHQQQPTLTLQKGGNTAENAFSH